MKIIDVKKANVIQNPHGIDARKIYDTENAQAVHLTLEPGESLKKHITSVDVFFYVLEGEGIVEIGEEKQKVRVDTLVDSPAKLPHCWHNEGEETLRILVVKVPRPTDPTRLL